MKGVEYSGLLLHGVNVFYILQPKACNQRGRLFLNFYILLYLLRCLCRRKLGKFLDKRINGLVGMTNTTGTEVEKPVIQSLHEVVAEVLAFPNGDRY